MTTTAYCKTCGAPFTASRTGYTVNCPAHRGRAAESAALVPADVLTTCYCGKTVTAGPGVPAGTTCPRECGPGDRAPFSYPADDSHTAAVLDRLAQWTADRR